ncbi:putative hydrolase or acyltransferase of alpha/beta superfamily [Frankia sp. CpI1-P]|uniref:alpha/beta fold hydrolase n=1 Tax=unclassified Frankia TaxID=2632575 RepID=UPI0006FC8557|nr:MULTISPECIES: alpha/beta hydrolase [unclassified Frankia]KQM02607.1 putative hydrolase or acyltransferase of alpha/beta superfamily [Frankia sp. CpI1-P]
MRLTTRPGRTIAVHDLGGDGPAILLCHATGFCGRAYEPLTRLLRASRRVWAVDLRGHGESPAPDDGDFAWVSMVDDVLSAARAVAAAAADADGSPGAVHLAGHSMGGAIGLQTEADHPGTFASAYVYEPVIFPPQLRPPRSNPMADAARKRREVFPSRAAALARYAARPPLRELNAGALAAYVEHGFEDLPDGTVRLRCRAESEARTFEASGRITWGTVAKAAVPTVVATGEVSDSELVPAAPGLAAALPAARHVSYGHLGHFGPLQDAVTVGRDILAHTTGH